MCSGTQPGIDRVLFAEQRHQNQQRKQCEDNQQRQQQHRLLAMRNGYKPAAASPVRSLLAVIGSCATLNDLSFEPNILGDEQHLCSRGSRRRVDDLFSPSPRQFDDQEYTCYRRTTSGRLEDAFMRFRGDNQAKFPVHDSLAIPSETAMSTDTTDSSNTTDVSKTPPRRRRVILMRLGLCLFSATLATLGAELVTRVMESVDPSFN